MSEGTTSVPRRRLRTSIVLLALTLGLLLAGVVGGWAWLRSDGDIRTIEDQAKAFGINLEPVPPPLTTPMRLAQAQRVEAMLGAITIPGFYFPEQQGIPPSSDFRKGHQEVSSRAMCDAATAFIELGSEPVVVGPRDSRPNFWSLGRILNHRILVSESDELDLCLAASQVQVEMGLRDKQAWWRWGDLQTFINFLPYRMPDQRERLRPLAEWLDTMATKLLTDAPQLAEQIFIRHLRNFRGGGEMIIKEQGMSLPGYLYLGDGLVLDVAMRKERARILQEERGWQQFLTAHPNQPRNWMDEAKRRFTALGGESSWLTINVHREILLMQHPIFLRRQVGTVLHARLFAAELRGLPWPIDVLDPAGAPLRRWEKEGRLIGAYSVGANGIDDGGDRASDITLRLYPEPPEPTPVP